MAGPSRPLDDPAGRAPSAAATIGGPAPARKPRTAPPGRFRRSLPSGGGRSPLRAIAFVIGAGLCLIVLTPLGAAFFGPVSPEGTAVILAGLIVCALIWLARESVPVCPVCSRGVLRREDVGSVAQKLGIVDHPMFRRHTWTEWYRCSQCGYREWNERADPES